MNGTGRYSMRSRPRVVLLLALALSLAAVASAGIAHRYRTLLSTSGLQSTTWPGASFLGPPLFTTRDALLRSDVVRARSARVSGPFSTESRGYLLVPASGRYRIVVIADDRASVEVDRQRVSGDRTHPGILNVQLTRGLHPINVRYADDGGQQALEILWARETGVPARISPLCLLPDIRPYEEVRTRRALTWAMPAVPAFWSAVLLVLAAVSVRALVRRLSLPNGRSFLPFVLVLAGVTFTCGIWWGLPDFYGWAPDELGPGDVNDALDRHFSGGWASIYPPLHYAVLTVFTAPFHLLSEAGLIDREHLYVHTGLFVVQRAVSVVMALGTLGLVYAIGSTITPRAGALAAAIVSVALPFAFYAKLANVDVPYVFWFALSMAFYLRMHRTGAIADFLLFVLAGVAAIATKDQAYGFYILPAAVILVSAFRRRRAKSTSAGVPSHPVLAAMIVLAIVGVLVFDNVFLNFSGFVEHLRIITGPGSQDFRMYDRTVAGQLRMLRDAGWQLGGAMSWPLFLAAVIGAVAAWRSHVTTVRLLLLPLLSYYVTFIAVVGYHYDRFFIGPVIILALAAGWWLDTWLAQAQSARRIRLVAVWCAFAYALSRVAALDGLMIFDSRYTVEQWLLQHAPPEAHIAAAGQYLPRGGRLFWTRLPQDPEALTRLAPDFVIVNVGTNRRWGRETEAGRFYDALSKEGSPYRLVLRHRTSLAWSPLRWEKRYADADEDPFTNLDKVNPLIEVYARNTAATSTTR